MITLAVLRGSLSNTSVHAATILRAIVRPGYAGHVPCARLEARTLAVVPFAICRTGQGEAVASTFGRKVLSFKGVGG